MFIILRKLHEQSLFRSLVEKISLNVPGQRDCIIGSKNPLKIDANASKERSLLEIPFAVCSGRNKKLMKPNKNDDKKFWQKPQIGLKQ